MTSPGPEDLVVTQATLDDWKVVGGWAADEGWNPGLSDRASFFAQDPEGFFIGRIGGEPVSAISVVNYGADYAFLGFYLVRPDLRGRGYGITTWKTALAHAAWAAPSASTGWSRSRTTTASRVSNSPIARSVSAEWPRWGRRRRESGPPRRRTSRRSRRTTVPAAQRTGRMFVESWLTGPEHRTFVRLADDGQLTGYGVIRPARDSLRIGPLFADTADDARALLSALAADAAGSAVAIDVPETNTAGIALVEELGLAPSFETARMYTGPVRPFAQERVYGVTTLELG